MKYFRLFEIVYLVIAVLSVIETYREWNTDRSRAYIFLFFAVIAIFMFFFRKHYRKKFQSRQNKK
ncbi:MAG: hypothetical protein KDD04_03415 [Sinomicrobium sp.]|nr:hypothetical protein [Sinomicrobium sp.]